MQDPPTLKKLLDRHEAADFLGVSVRTIDEQTSNGSLKCVRIGRSVRFRPATLESYTEANESAVPNKRRRVKG